MPTRRPAKEPFAHATFDSPPPAMAARRMPGMLKERKAQLNRENYMRAKKRKETEGVAGDGRIGEDARSVDDDDIDAEDTRKEETLQRKLR